MTQPLAQLCKLENLESGILWYIEQLWLTQGGSWWHLLTHVTASMLPVRWWSQLGLRLTFFGGPPALDWYVEYAVPGTLPHGYDSAHPPTKGWSKVTITSWFRVNREIYCSVTVRLVSVAIVRRRRIPLQWQRCILGQWSAAASAAGSTPRLVHSWCHCYWRSSLCHYKPTRPICHTLYSTFMPYVTHDHSFSMILLWLVNHYIRRRWLQSLIIPAAEHCLCLPPTESMNWSLADKFFF